MRTGFSIFIAVMLHSLCISQTSDLMPASLQESVRIVPAYIEGPPDADELYAIYPGNGIPAESADWSWHEQTAMAPWTKEPNTMVRNVVIPTLTMFKPGAPKANGTAMIIAPGGAFHFLMMDHEGYDVARWLIEQGITAFVLKYRVQHTPEDDTLLPLFLDTLFSSLPHVSRDEMSPPMTYPPAEEGRLWGEEDGRQAIRFIRTHARKLGIDPSRIGIMGFSAGGGIAVNAALESDQLSRPDFVAGIYPGYRKVDSMPGSLPPLFIAIADNDDAVAPMSSAKLYTEWHMNGGPVELHIFESGGHGFGMRVQGLHSDSWTELFENWLIKHAYSGLDQHK